MQDFSLTGELCRGEFVTISWPDDGDSDSLTALRNHPSARRWFRDHREVDFEANRQWIRQLPRPRESLLVIRHSASGVFLGSIGWTNWDDLAKTATFGRLAVDRRSLRRVATATHVPGAVAVDAARALRDFAFEKMDLANLDTWYAADNVLAARVNATVGMVVIGSGSLARPDGQPLAITRAMLTRERWRDIRQRERRT